MAYRIVTLSGDGIGPEIMAPTLELLNRLGDFEFEEHLFGGASIDAHGVPLTDEVLSNCHDADAILVGAVGGSKRATADLSQPTPEKGLLELRKRLGLYTNLRPAETMPGLFSQSPLRPELLKGVELTVVRELTGGVYFGEQQRTATMGSSLYIYTVEEVERIAREAFKYAKRKVTNVDKANALEVGAFWRSVVTRVHQEEFPQIELEHLYFDNALIQLASKPRDFDVILADSYNGDAISDLAGIVAGSLGVLPSACMGDWERLKKGSLLFEPVHGSAPDIAGQGIANPLAMLLSGALALGFLGMSEQAEALGSAVDYVIEKGIVTPDLGGSASTQEVAKAVTEQL